MKTKLFITVLAFTLTYVTTYAQWQNISPDTVSNFTRVFFTTQQKGYVIACDPNQSSWSANGLYRTTDGGNTWTGLLASELCPPDVFFTDSNVGYYFTSGSAINAAGVNKTTDGGTTWRRVYNGLPGEHVFFVDAAIGYATAANTMAKTTDSGATWTQQYLGGPSVLDAVCYINKDTGFIGGWYNSVIAKTTNGGNTWTILSTGYGIHALKFVSDQVGYAAGEDIANNNPVIIKTTDGGNTWTVKYRISSPAPFFFTSLYCIDINTCYAAGAHGTILKTTDAGLTWTQEASGTTRKINSIYCMNGNCYAAGDTGIVLRTTIASTATIQPATKKTPGASIFPNPAGTTATLNIDGQAPQNTVFRLFDIMGRQVAQYTIVAARTQIDMKQLSPGLYYYTVCSMEGWLGEGRIVVR